MKAYITFFRGSPIISFKEKRKLLRRKKIIIGEKVTINFKTASGEKLKRDYGDYLKNGIYQKMC